MSEGAVEQGSVSVSEVLSRVAEVAAALSRVSQGDYTTRLDDDLPPDHPLRGLYGSINEMVDSLAAAHRRSVLYQQELEDKLATIEKQRAAIRELSTPIIEIWHGILCLPIVGVMDSSRSADMMEALLRAVSEKGAVCAIVDITGIEVMDTRTADHFLRMARAVRLLGAECVLTGLNPNIAQTVVRMGLDMAGIISHRTVRQALQHLAQRGLLQVGPASAAVNGARPAAAAAGGASR